jgi:hypothetical protein
MSESNLKEQNQEASMKAVRHKLILTDEQLDYLFQITDSDQSSDHPLVRRASRNINRKILTLCRNKNRKPNQSDLGLTAMI